MFLILLISASSTAEASRGVQGGQFSSSSIDFAIAYIGDPCGARNKTSIRVSLCFFSTRSRSPRPRNAAIFSAVSFPVTTRRRIGRPESCQSFSIRSSNRMRIVKVITLTYPMPPRPGRVRPTSRANACASGMLGAIFS